MWANVIVSRWAVHPSYAVLWRRSESRRSGQTIDNLADAD
jgi:hypothetical protein